MRNFFLATLLLAAGMSSKAVAQDLFYESYKWEDPVKLPIETEEDKLVLKDKEVVEFHFNGQVIDEYYLRHLVEYINVDEEVESNNKKYLPYSEGQEIIEAKARVIKPNNEVQELGESKILTSTDEETGQHYKYFALEGLEPGSVVEVQYVLRKEPELDGKTQYVQTNYPIQRYEFDIYCPWELVFDFKPFNDTNQVKMDSVDAETKRYYLHLDSVPKLEHEDMAPYFWLVHKFVYKLDKILYSSERDYSSYGKISTSYYSQIYQNIERSEEKAIKKLLKEIDVSAKEDDETKIKKVENYLKNNIRVVEVSAPELVNISSIYSNKIASKFGMSRLFALLFKELDVEHQLVLTCDSEFGRFDTEFESYINITDHLFYFPQLDIYIAPAEYGFRYGLIPSYFADNYGLFIKESSVGDFKTGVGITNYIEPLGYDKTFSKLDIKVDLTADMQEVNVEMEKSSMGYYASFVQPYLDLMNEETKTDLIEEDIKSTLEDMEIDEWETENGSADLVGQKPFIIKCSGKYDKLIDNAGDKYLVKIGELIGPQMELYSSEERDLPVYNQYKRMYERKISINIPEGYQIANLDDLKIFANYEKDGKERLLFKSDYEVKDNKVLVDIREYYDQLYFEVDEYKHYREVINSASDFNKVVLVLEKKG